MPVFKTGAFNRSATLPEGGEVTAPQGAGNRPASNLNAASTLSANRPATRLCYKARMRNAVISILGAGLAGVVLAPQASAQAEIVYMGAARAEAAAPRMAAALPGGDVNSYGYGAARGQGGDVLDLRRGGGASAPISAPAQPPAPAERARPDWLETERVGPPYEVNGRWYAPTAEPGYDQTGTASWYGPNFHGHQTANGEIYDETGLTAAHPTLPLNSLVQVTNLDNGREAILRITDRGPFVGDRLIDVSRGAAEALGFQGAGTTRVNVRYLGPAPRRVSPDGSAPAQLTPASYSGEPASLLPPAAPATPVVERSVVMGAYFVQIGAFADASNAERVRQTLDGTGNVLVEERATSRGALYRVRVGGFADRASAEAARARVADLGYRDAVVAGP